MTTARGSLTRTATLLRRRLHQPSVATIPASSRQMSTSEPILGRKLEGKVAIITGAAGAIGTATARLFAEHGAQVILADIADEKGHDKASAIGSNAHYRHCDVSKEDDIASTVDFAMEKFGKLDIMLNNAGIVTPVDSFETLDIEAYDRYTSVMVRGVVVGIKHAARVMIPVKQGVILNTGSIAAVVTGAAVPLVYNINKSNLPGLTRIAAYHLGKHGIRVNAISPQAIFNEMVADWLGRLGCTFDYEQAEQLYVKHSGLLGKRCTEEDIAKGALFLCSNDSTFVSGQNLMVDAGWCNSKEHDVVADLFSAAGK